MSAAEYRDWQLYLASGTVLERLVDIHLARLTAIMDAMRSRRRVPRALKNFLLLPPVPQPPLTPEQWLEKVKAINEMFGGTVIDKRGGKH